MDANLQSFLGKLNQGPVQLMLDPDGTPVELFVNDGIDLTLMRPHAEANVDVLGLYDLYTEGDGAEFETNLPETSLDILQVLFPEGVDGSGVSPSYQGFGRAAGHSMRTHALEARIRPYSSKDSDTEQIILWKVVPTGDIGVGLSKSDPHAHTVTWRALPDPSQVDGELIGRYYAAARS